MTEKIVDHFEQVLLGHKLNPVRYRDWVTVGGGYPAFRAFYQAAAEEHSSGRLDVQVMPGQNIAN